MASTRPKKNGNSKKAKSRSRKQAVATKDEGFVDSANGTVDVDVNKSVEQPSQSFWKKYHGNFAVIIRRVAGFDPSRYDREGYIPLVTPPKQVRFDDRVEMIEASGAIRSALTGATFDLSPESSETEDNDLSEDELSSRRVTRSRALPPKTPDFAVVIKKSPSSASPEQSPSGSTPRVTRHNTTTRLQFRLAVNGSPDAVPSSILKAPRADVSSVRSSIHSRIDDKYAASRTRSAITVANRTASKVVSKVKKIASFATKVVKKAALATKKRSSRRIAAKAARAALINKNDEEEEDEEEEEAYEEEEDYDDYC